MAERISFEALNAKLGPNTELVLDRLWRLRDDFGNVCSTLDDICTAGGDPLAKATVLRYLKKLRQLGMVGPTRKRLVRDIRWTRTSGGIRVSPEVLSAFNATPNWDVNRCKGRGAPLGNKNRSRKANRYMWLHKQGHEVFADVDDAEALMADGWQRSKRSEFVWMSFGGDQEAFVPVNQVANLAQQGWAPGRARRTWSPRRGKSPFGWVHRNGEEKLVRLDSRDGYLADGWACGRKPARVRAGRPFGWVCQGTSEAYVRLDAVGAYLAEGWQRGRARSAA